MPPPTILVTGATGLVGSHLVKMLSQQGKSIRALYHSSYPDNSLSGVEWMKVDMLDVIELETAMTGIRNVYHCAAIVSFSYEAKNILYHTNIQGTANVVNSCITANVEKLLFVSSVAALGRMREGEVINEESQWTEDANNSKYGKSKYISEMEVWRGIGEGLKAVIVNPSIILGAGDWNKGSSALFKSAYNEFPWYTEGVTGFVDVTDVTKAMICLMESDITNERFLLSAENISYKKLFTTMATCFNKKPPYKRVNPLIAAIVWRIESLKAFFLKKQPLLTRETAKAAQAKVYFDNSKIKDRLPYFTFKPLEQSIQKVCEELKIRYNLG